MSKQAQLTEKFDKEMESYVLNFGQKEKFLTLENERLKKTIEEISENNSKEVDSMTKNYEDIISKHNGVISEKDAFIKTLEEKLKNMETLQPKISRSLDEELFRTKPRKGKGSSNSSSDSSLKCQYQGCINESEDALVKCNSCGVWVCETCHDVPIPKLKPVMNKCGTVLFTCKECFASICNGTATTKRCDGEKASEPEIISSLKEMFDKKIVQLESTFESIIENKLVAKLNTEVAVPTNGELSSTPAAAGSSYASKVLQLPSEVRKALQDAKNDEKVEDSEKEKRSCNFVIHGAEEIGSDANEIKENDTQYLRDILRKLEVASQPESVTRLGAPGNSGKRPIKVIMKSKADQQSVMSNLRRLKGTEQDFGKISVTEDYTQNEREQIKQWTNKAKEQSANDKEYIYKVRGDPKNGLRLIRVARK